MARHTNRSGKLSGRKSASRFKPAHRAILILGAFAIILAVILHAPHPIQQPEVSPGNTSIQSTTAYNVSVPTAYNPANSTTLNISFNIINDTAAGRYGFWALGNYTENVYASYGGNLGYNAIVTFHGTWRSVKGARSPVTGALEPANGSGQFIDIYNAIIPGRLNDTLKLSGYVGTFNDGGTFKLILENQSNQTRPAVFNWLGHYFGTSGDYVSFLNSNAVFMYDNQTMEILCGPANCTYSATPGSYFLGAAANSTTG